MKIEFSPRALRDLQGLEKPAAKQMLDDLSVLEKLPWPGPPKIKKLTGSKGLHRLRSGSFRAIFEPIPNGVVVLRVMDRKEFERVLRNL